MVILDLGLPHREAYWGGKNSAFVVGAKEYFRDKDVEFISYDPYSWSTAEARREEGRQYAREHLKELTTGLKDDEGFEIVSHSMGGAFAEGLEDVLKAEGYSVSEAVFINTFQAADIVDNQAKPSFADDGTFSIDYQFSDDPVINNSARSSPGDIQGAFLKIRTASMEKDWKDIHADPIWQGTRMWKDIMEKIKNPRRTKRNSGIK